MKRLLLIFSALLVVASGAWAETVTITYGTDAGTFYKNKTTATTSEFVNKWVSTRTNPQLTMEQSTSSVNNINSANNYMFSKSDGAETYTLSVPNGFIITGYTLTGTASKHNNSVSKIIFQASGHDAVQYADGASVSEAITGVNAQSTTFTLEGKTDANANGFCKITEPSLAVTIVQAVAYGATSGTFYNTSGSNVTNSNSYAGSWISTSTNPQVTITSNANNITSPGRTSSEGAASFYAHGGKTYTISVPNNAIITGYTISGQSYNSSGNAGNDISATTTAGPSQTFTGSAVATLTVSDKDLRSTSFTFTGTDAFLRPSSFIIYTENDQTFVANKASISNAKSYMVHGERGDWYYASSSATSLSFNTTFDRTDDTRQIAFIKSATTGNYYAYSVITGKFITSSNTLSETPEPIYIFETGNANYPFFFSFESDKSDKNINISSGVVTFSDYSTYDAGNRWCLYGAEEFDIPSAVSTAITDFETANITCTYKLNYNGNVIAEREVTQAVGSTAVSPWTVPAFCSMGECDPETIDENTEEVNITMTSSLPFTLSADYANATWYYMTIRDQYYVIFDPSSANKTSTSSVTEKTDAVATAERALWAFIGDPVNGIKVLNKAAGDGLYLNSAETPLRMKVSDGYAIWELGQNSTGFTLNNGGYYVNDVNRALGYWSNESASTDEGSTMRVEAVDYYDLAMAYIDQYSTARAVADDGYFGVRTATKDYYKSTISTAFSANHAGVTKSIYENTIKPGCDDLIQLPETGYYRLKNVNETGKYLGYDGTADEGSSICLRGMADNTSAKTVIHFVKDGDNNSYQLSLEGTYIAAVSSGTKRTPSSTPANYKAEYVEPGMGSFSTTLSGDTYLHCSASQQYAIVGWRTGKTSPASKWTIEKVSSINLTLNDGGDGYYYATMYMPFDVTISSGTTAYTLTVSGNYAIASEVEGNEVPAGTAVLLRGSSSSCTATINTGSAFNGGAPLDDNDLTGTYVDITGDRTTGEYIFGKVDDKVGFYVRKSSNKIGANKGYLLLGSDVSVKGFAIQWDFEDAIKDMDNTQQSNNNSGIYNLAGQRVKNAQKGIYIVNSKKVLVK